MELVLQREPTSRHATLGKLTIDGAHECDTLEDAVREVPGEPVAKWKVPGETAIPAGRYRVRVTYSERFRRKLPILASVRGFEGIRIHAGNTIADTEGCILVGQRSGPATIEESRRALLELMLKIGDAEDRGEEVWIAVRNYDMPDFSNVRSGHG